MTNIEYRLSMIAHQLTNQAMNELSPATGPEGRFLAFFSVLVYACFTYAGVEMLAAAGGETENPRVNIPIAFRRVVYCILGFYVLGTFFVGCIVAVTTLISSQHWLLMLVVQLNRPGLSGCKMRE